MINLMTDVQLENMLIDVLANSTNAFHKQELKQQIEILNGTEICKRLGITIQTLIRWKAKGKVPFFKLGGSIRYDYFKVLEALEVTSKKKGLVK